MCGRRGLLDLYPLSRTPTAGWRCHPVGHATGRDEETRVADHPVIGPHGKPFDMPVANQGLPRMGLRETPVFAQSFDRTGQLSCGCHIAADNTARSESLGRGVDALP